MAEMTGKMKIQCCMCQKILGTKPCVKELNGQITDSYCPACLEKANEETDEYFNSQSN